MKCLLISKGPAANGFSEEQTRNEEIEYRMWSSAVGWGGLQGFQLRYNFFGRGKCLRGKVKQVMIQNVKTK